MTGQRDLAQELTADATSLGGPAALRLGRRDRLFMACCLALASITPAGAMIGMVQPMPRGAITASMVTAQGAAALLAWWLTRRGDLATGIHVLCAAVSGAVVAGCFLSGRVAMAAFMLFVPMSLATLHREPQRILVDFAVVFGSALLMAVALPPIDPALFPALFVMLVLVGLIAFFSARVNRLNHLDLQAANAQLKQLNADLGESTRRAEAANEAKSLFLATMSHELRTPLNAVIGYTEMVQDTLADESEPLDRADAHADLDHSLRAAQRLLTQVNRILDLSRVEAEEVVHTQPTALAPVLKAAVERHRAAAEAKGLALRAELTESTGAIVSDDVSTDAERVHRILDDLLDNAVRFTATGEIVVSLSHTDTAATITVADTGVGIDPAQLERIFLPFTQADGSYTRQVDGVGLGLTLCRRLAQSIGAELTLSSPRRGTVARLVLPRRG